MPKTFLAVVLLLLTLPVHAATPDWNKRLAGAMSLLGHRNWILVVDSAYPLQTAPGIETIETMQRSLRWRGQSWVKLKTHSGRSRA